MRHLLAMLARDRIQRHHAARANQAAQLPMPNQEEESDSEDEADELQLHNRDQGAQPQLYLGPDDNYFVSLFFNAIHPITKFPGFRIYSRTR
jgi:hypothetical protein